MGAQGPTVLTLAHLASVASRRRAWLASPTRACSPVGPPHRRTAGRVSRAAVPSARPRPYLRPPTPTAPRRWKRRRRRPAPAGRSRPSCATALNAAHKTNAVAVAKTRADSETLCAAAVARGRPARHTHARCRHKQVRRNHGVCGAPPSSSALPLPVPAARASGHCVGRPARLPGACSSVARRRRPSLGRHRRPWDGTARHAQRAAPKSRDRSGPWRTEIASRRGSAGAPVGSARAGVRVRGWVEHARHTRAWPLTPLPPPVSLSVCLCLCERKGQAVSVCFCRRCTWPLAHCDRVPGRASCLVLCLATLCVCV
jgi:hypothetical protein